MAHWSGSSSWMRSTTIPGVVLTGLGSTDQSFQKLNWRMHLRKLKGLQGAALCGKDLIDDHMMIDDDLKAEIGTLHEEPSQNSYLRRNKGKDEITDKYEEE
ncbi:hypothetical protein PPACK8108_LOCUS2723 [Phakopsora pachyrhizi]|uniref:Uncharacterized protein n=1 Tax=Phakopsora pachyrhizi TaxID=170000 RepID=A0AAV0AJQ5_PHAPC|nr:hypothetical protein PPACK8108_LOCUS2723 [Phakopsora pachyrhizi]